MKNIFILIMFMAIAGVSNAQNNVILQQSTGGNTNVSAPDDKQYYINGISTKEDVGGVEISRGNFQPVGWYHLKFTNYNNFVVSVIYEVEDHNKGLVTGNIVLNAGETKESRDMYQQPINFKVIARKMNAAYQSQSAVYQAAPAVNSGGGTVSMRIGVVCTSELLPQLPEYASVQDKIKKFSQDKQAEYDNLVKEGRASQETISRFTEELERYQRDLMAPVFSRIWNAVDAVGRANGYDVIVDISPVYRGKAFFELDSLVRKELGIDS